MFAPLFAEAAPEPFSLKTIDSAVTQLSSFLDEIAKDTPWLTDIVIANNALWRILMLFIAVLLTMGLGRVVRFGLHRAATKAENNQSKITAAGLLALAHSTGLMAFAFGLPIGLKFLILNDQVENIAGHICQVLMTAAVGWSLYCLVDMVDQSLRAFSNRTRSRLDDMLAPLITRSIRTTIVILALVHVATILSPTPPTSIIASLGVGGLAIGLAAQDTIKNIFGSLMIFSDRPFELGDEISVDGNAGVVETVGFRSTRFRTGTGHVITIPNGDLANKPIVNISRRRNLGRTLNLQLPSDLPPDKMEDALAICRVILENHEGQLPSQPAKVFFSEITPTALNIQIQYWFHPPDGSRFAALNERVNMDILRKFHEAEIPLAMPRQRIELEKSA
jgi:MscS family membrane protein